MDYLTVTQPYLVITQGIPGSGKTVIARYLKKELGFVHLGTEEYLKRRFGTNRFVKTRKKSDWWWEEVWNRSVVSKCAKALASGKSVVVDTTNGALKWPVGRYRVENLFLRFPQAQRYLLEITAPRKIMIDRISKRSKVSPKKALDWFELYDWKRRWRPTKNLPVKVLIYKNRTEEDLQKIEKRLKLLFKP